jgi:hypothetical protein
MVPMNMACSVVDVTMPAGWHADFLREHSENAHAKKRPSASGAWFGCLDVAAAEIAERIIARPCVVHATE